MKTCEDMRAALVDLVFGEMDDRAEAELNEHLLGCSTCRIEEARLLELRAGVRGTERAPAMELRRRIERALPAREPGPSGGAWTRPIPAYVALAAGVIGAALVLLLPTRRDVPAPPVVEKRRPAGLAIEGEPPTFTIAGSFETGVRQAEPAPSGRDSSSTHPHPPKDSL